ncbi:MAG: carboxypeptidase regulatory-like domain-containing protein [Planctomycetota bacterium]|jgi:protocatechuate 3,4-dioxygenase beta subunit
MGNPIVKLTVAALIVVAILITIRLLTIQRERPGKVIVEHKDEKRNGIETPENIQPTLARERQAELDNIRQMFLASDVDGLVTMLAQARFDESKFAAADYLAKIGDDRAIDPLEKLSKDWKHQDVNNPYAAAIKAIEERLKQEGKRAQSTEPAEPSATETRPAVTKFTFKPKGVLSGLVTDAETNEPVVGARIEIRNRERYKTETDSSGSYYFDKVKRDGSYTVTIYSTDYMWFGNWSDMPVVELQSDSQQVSHFSLKLGCQIDVEVVDEHNEPLEAVNLHVSWMGQRYGREVDRRRRFKTGDDGTALLGAFEPSDVPCLITAIHDDYALAKCIVKLTDPNIVEYARIVMQQGLTVQGYAEYEDGVPVKDLAIQARPHWWNIGHNPRIVPTDSQGYFTFTHITPGLYTIYLRRTKSTLSPVTQIKLPSDDELLFVKIPRQSPQSSSPTANGVDGSADSSDTRVSIGGTIVSVGNADIGQVKLNAYSRTDGRGVGRIDGNRFTVDSLKPGFYTLIFSGDNSERKILTNVRAPSVDLEVELRSIGKARVRGVVVHADTNEPVARFKLRVMKLKTLRNTGRQQRRDWSSFGSPTGQFDLEVAEPGVYQVQVVADGLAAAWSGETNTDEDEPVVVRLNSGGSIKGRVVNQANEPIADAKVIPLSLACGPEPAAMHVFFTETGAVKAKAGEFILKNLPQGLESIKVTHPGYCFAVVKDIEIQQGGTTPLTVMLSKGAVVEGYVYDDRGKPQAHELLYFQDAPAYRFGSDVGRLASALTDANGFYRAEKLPESLCYVRRAKWDRLGVIARTVLPVKGKVTQLDFGGRARIVTGRILLDNQPLADTKMLLGDPYDRNSYAFFSYAKTDADGRFTFSGIPAGWHAVYYELAQNRNYSSNDWAKVATFLMADEDADLGTTNIRTTTVTVSVNFEQWNEVFEGYELYLQKGRDFWGVRFGAVTKPQNPADPYTMTGVPGGTYSLVVKRADHAVFMEQVKVDAGQNQTALTINIPRCAASLEGMLQAHPEVFVRLRRDDGGVIAVISARGDGTYCIQNLPAGKYTIAGIYEGDSNPLASLTLTDNRTTYLDIDPWQLAQLIKAGLHTQVVDQSGAPITAASVWLESDDARIEPCRITEQGQFFVCEPGHYTLRVSCDGYEPVEKPIHLQLKDLFATGWSEGTMIITLGD